MIAMSDTRANLVLQEGWLMKRSRHLKLWRKRWVVLTSEGLSTFKRAPCGNHQLRPTEDLSFRQGLDAKRASVLTYNRLCVLELRAEGRVFPFAATSLRDRDAWVKAIKNCQSASCDVDSCHASSPSSGPSTNVASSGSSVFLSPYSSTCGDVR